MAHPSVRNSGLYQQPQFGASDRALSAPTAERIRSRGNFLGNSVQVNPPLFKGDGNLMPPQMCAQMPMMKASRYIGKTRRQLVTESIMNFAGPKNLYGPSQRGFQEVPLIVSPDDRINIKRRCTTLTRVQDTIRRVDKEQRPPPFTQFRDATETPKTLRLTAPTPNCLYFCDQRLQARNAAERYVHHQN